MEPGDLGGAIRCPACRAVDWFRSGIQITEGDEGRPQVQDVAGAGWIPDPGWSCAQCAYEVPTWSRLATALDGVVAAEQVTAP